MRFSAAAPRRRPREAIVPMINVVFLLLIFFLMSATVAAPPPFEMTLPEAGEAEAAGAADVLFVAADGTLAYGSARGDAVFVALAGREAASGPLDIRADAGLPAAALAALLPRLARAGVTETRLVTVRE